MAPIERKHHKELLRKNLRQALKAALMQKSISKISLASLVAECEISKNTFYHYYANIDALLKELIDEEADALLTSSVLHSADLGCLVYALSELKNTATLWKNIARGDRLQLVHEVFYLKIQHYLGDSIRAQFTKYEYTPELLDFIVGYRTESVITTVSYWILNDSPLPLEKIAKYLPIAAGIQNQEIV